MPEKHSPPDRRAALFWICAAALFWSLPVLLAGGWTTTINAGMAFLDWPLSDGSVNPAGFLVETDRTAEHSHRLAATTLGVIALILAGAHWRFETRRWVRRLAFGLPALVLFQGVLGGCRVLFDPQNFADLTSAVSRTFAISHAVTAFITVGLIAMLVVAHTRFWFAESGGEISARIRKFATFSAVAIWIQALLGALVRQHRWGIWDMPDRPRDAGLAYLAEWATGRPLARMSAEWPFALNAAHRLGAVFVGALTVIFFILVFRDFAARRALGGFAAALLGLTLFQIALGVTQVWFNGNSGARMAHHLAGAAVFCLAVATALFGCRDSLRAGEARA